MTFKIFKSKYRKLTFDILVNKLKKKIKKYIYIIFFLFILIILLLILFLSIINKYPKGITGFQIVGTRLIITSTVQSFCNLSLSQGWNLISFSCLGDDTNIKLFFNNATFINDSFKAIFSYDVNDVNDPWKSYNPYLPNWTIQDLSYISRRRGYWIYFENQSNLIINGSLKTPTLIYLKKGWNLLGYPSLTNKPINETYDRLKPDYDYIYMYNSSNNEWKQYTWNTSKPSLQNLNYTIINFGYWIYILNDSSIIILD